MDRQTYPRFHLSKPNLHPKKILLTVWWCCNGAIHYGFLQPGQTSRQGLIAVIWSWCTKRCKHFGRQWWKEGGLSCFRITQDLTFHTSPSKNWRSWTPRSCPIRLTHRTFPLPSTTFSRRWTSSCSEGVHQCGSGGKCLPSVFRLPWSNFLS